MMSTPLIQPVPAAEPQVAGLRRTSWRPDRTLVILLVLTAALPYANTLLNSFVIDDTDQVLRNPYVRSFRYLPQIFTTSAWSFIPGNPSNYYRPLMTFGYLLCHKIFGFAPWGFHLANILLHTAVVCMLFFLTLRLFRDRTLAFAAAAVFALHPIHTESVAWVAAVTDLELTFFYLLTFWFFLDVARPEGKRSERTYLAMLGSFVLALLSKEQALTLPFLATVYEHFYREDKAETTRGQKFARYHALWLLVIAYLLCRVRFLGGFAPEAKFPDLTPYQTFLSAFALVGQYLWKLLWPLRLCAYYVFHKSVSLLDPRVLFGGLGGLILCAALFVFLWKHARGASFGLLWLFATLAPVLNAHWVGLNVFTERYLYLPSVGFCWVAAWGLHYLWAACSSRRPAWRNALAAALGLLAVLCVFRIVTRNGDWQSNSVVIATTLAVSPDADGLRIAVGEIYADQGDLAGAEREFRQVLERDPNSLDALNNLGMLFMEKGRYVEAMGFFLRAIEVKPKDGRARTNLGVIYWRRGLMEQAELNLRAGVSLAPLDFLGYLNLGNFYWQKGDHRRAEATLEGALSAIPFDPLVHLALAKLYAQEGRTSDAARECRAVLEGDPANLEAALCLERLTSGSAAARPSKP